MPGPRTTLVLRKRYPNQNPNSNRRGAYPNPRGVYPNPRGVYPNPRGVYPNPRGRTLTLKNRKNVLGPGIIILAYQEYSHHIYIYISLILSLNERFIVEAKTLTRILKSSRRRDFNVQ